MKPTEIPQGSTFLDVDGIPVVRLPNASLVAFSKGADAESRAYPDTAKVGEGDALDREEFLAWLSTGTNRFDVRKPAASDAA